MHNQHTKNIYAFTLGREWKLSLAELFAVFGHEAYRSHSETIALFQIVGYSDEQLQKKFLTLGGSIRIIRILGETDVKRFATDVIREITENYSENTKVTFALGAYGVYFPLSDIGLRIKKTLSEKHISCRLINQENKNINAASFKKERLAKSGNEYNLIQIESPENTEKTDDVQPAYIGVTLACQDIDAYAKRDTAKSRDMIVGMMPPKLVQMMINIALSGESPSGHQIYDPFCGLGTTLIEAANMGILSLFGSDLSSDMVRATEKSLEAFVAEEKVWQDRIKAAGGLPAKDFTHLKKDIVTLDARDIHLAQQKIPELNLRSEKTHIVSEGYLGEVMSPRDISLDRVQSERKKLASMYAAFFGGLRKSDFRGTLVMSFPFWNIHTTYSYFTEIYEVIEKSGFAVESLLPWEMKLNTNKGSLLYRRETQTVGREIVKIVRKP